VKHGYAIGLVVGLGMGSLLANGGGYFRGGVEHAGDVQGFEPKATENIRIIDEKLTVRLGPGEADVEVRYLMRNATANRVTVRFGFPVEESFDNNDFIPQAERAAQTWKEPKYCQGYQISAGGKAVKAKWQDEQKPTRKEAADPRFKGIAGWLVSEMTFVGGEEKPVLIRFRSSYPHSAYSVSEDGRASAAIFRYRLSSAACWAGTIGSGRIVLKPAGIDPAELKVLKPVNRFRKQGDSWVWDFENLEPTLADDLEIEAVAAVNSYGRSLREGDRNSPQVDYLERGGKWSMLHSNYTAKASSVLRSDGDLSYAVANLHDNDPGNVWSEGAPGPGVGAWLELRPEVVKPLTAIEISPGYQKSADLFSSNARPKRVKVTLNEEHSFTADVPDKQTSCRIPVRGYAKTVRVVKLIFEDVWPGAKFEDLCVSGIFLEVALDKKPKITPQR
jgi:hypothetical protein